MTLVYTVEMYFQLLIVKQYFNFTYLILQHIELNINIKKKRETLFNIIFVCVAVDLWGIKALHSMMLAFDCSGLTCHRPEKSIGHKN